MSSRKTSVLAPDEQWNARCHINFSNDLLGCVFISVYNRLSGLRLLYLICVNRRADLYDYLRI
jgi:hypothetical protein